MQGARIVRDKFILFAPVIVFLTPKVSLLFRWLKNSHDPPLADHARTFQPSPRPSARDSLNNKNFWLKTYSRKKNKFVPYNAAVTCSRKIFSMRAVWIQFVFLSELEVLAKKCMMVRAFKTEVLNGQTCLSIKVLENFNASFLTTEPAYIFGR